MNTAKAEFEKVIAYDRWNPTTRERDTFTAKVRVEVNLDLIANTVGGRALRNRSGQSVEIGGLVKVTRLTPDTSVEDISLPHTPPFVP